MNFKKSFPSKYLSVTDLANRPVAATIKSVSAENVGPAEAAELKLVVRFEEPDVKPLVCNLTRAEAIAELAGSEDTDNWVGTRILIRKGSTSYKGKRVACIIVERPTTGPATDGAGSASAEVGF